MDLETLIGAVKAKIGDLIQKPKMTDKLLSKPPFRFLHDTLSAITATTGFGEGLLSNEEKDGAAITEKTAKLAYLDKMANFTGICKVLIEVKIVDFKALGHNSLFLCQGAPLDFRSAKVVAGLEPENTNAFLLAFAECASDPSFDNAEAVRRCLSGESPGGPQPLKKVNSVQSSICFQFLTTLMICTLIYVMHNL